MEGAKMLLKINYSIFITFDIWKTPSFVQNVDWEMSFLPCWSTCIYPEMFQTMFDGTTWCRLRRSYNTSRYSLGDNCPDGIEPTNMRGSQFGELVCSERVPKFPCSLIVASTMIINFIWVTTWFIIDPTMMLHGQAHHTAWRHAASRALSAKAL